MIKKQKLRGKEMKIRDGIFLSMYGKNDRNLASQLEKAESKINAEIDKVVSAIEKSGD